MSAPGDAQALADPESLRRIERFAAGWLAVGILAAVAAAIAVPERWRGAVALTLAGVASIVAFRGLQRVVAALGPAPLDPVGRTDPSRATRSQRESEETTDDESRPRRSRVRPLALAAGRMVILGAPVGAAFFLGTESLPGLIAGYTVVPAALITEGLAEIVRTVKGKGDRDVR